MTVESYKREINVILGRANMPGELSTV